MEGRKKDEGAAPWTHLQLGFRPEQRTVRQVLVARGRDPCSPSCGDWELPPGLWYPPSTLPPE